MNLDSDSENLENTWWWGQKFNISECFISFWFLKYNLRQHFLAEKCLLMHHILVVWGNCTICCDFESKKKQKETKLTFGDLRTSENRIDITSLFGWSKTCLVVTNIWSKWIFFQNHLKSIKLKLNSVTEVQIAMFCVNWSASRERKIWP